MHVSTSTILAAVTSLAVASLAVADAAPVALTALAANNITKQPTCNAGCIPKGLKKKDGEHLCCTGGSASLFKCPGPAHYQCGPAAPELWFKSYRSKYSGVIRDQNSCGEVNAAPFMGADLFDSKNAAALEAYKKFTLNGFGPPTGDGSLELGRCADPTSAFDPDCAASCSTNVGGVAYTAPYSKQPSNLFWNSGFDMDSLCRKRCDCSYTCDLVTCKDPCTDVPDEPTKGRYCSLCGPKYKSGKNAVVSWKIMSFFIVRSIIQSAFRTCSEHSAC
jgi:hypothetical protein